MFILALAIIPLFLICYIALSPKENIKDILWSVVSAFLTAIVIIFILSIVTSSLQDIKWNNMFTIFLYYALTDFFIPGNLMALTYCSIVKHNVISTKIFAASSFFILTLAFIMLQRVTWYHIYYSYYELLFLPLSSLILGFHLSFMFSKFIRVKAFIYSQFVFFAYSIIALCNMTNYKNYAMMIGCVVLVISIVISLLFFIQNKKSSYGR